MNKEINKGFFIEAEQESEYLKDAKLLKMMSEVFGMQALPLGVVELAIEGMEGRCVCVFFVMF
jgi:hypothetical protein